MEIGIGILGWAPAEFWRATPADLFAGVRGWREAHNPGGGRRPGELAPSAEEVQAMLEADQ